MARLPRVANIGVKAAGDSVRFDWTWEGRRSVEVRVLRSDQWSTESPDSHLDGSWGQQLVHEGDAPGFVDGGVADDRDLFYSVFARFKEGPWRAPVRVRVHAVGYEPAALGLPPSGVAWQTPHVAEGHRLVDIEGHAEVQPLSTVLLPDDLRDEAQRAHVVGQAHVRAVATVDRPSARDPAYVATLRRWRVVWMVVGGVATVALMACAELVTPAAFVAIGLTIFAFWRPTLGPDAEPPKWLRPALLGLSVVGIMAAEVLQLVGGMLGSLNISVLVFPALAALLVTLGSVMYGGLVLGHYVYGNEGLPDRVWLVAILLVLDAACVVAGLPAVVFTVMVALGFWIAGTVAERGEKETHRIARAERTTTAREEHRRRRREELTATVVDPEELARRHAERVRAAKEACDDEEWWPPSYRV